MDTNGMRLSPFGKLIVWIVLPALAIWIIHAATQPEPPPHRVTGWDRIDSGWRIAVAVEDPYLSPADCVKLLARYRNDAKGGQVSVHAPLSAAHAKPYPMCYDNQDGKGAQFNPRAP